jgi:3',5'-cyclic-AMP phosphodiesterase
MPRTLNRRSFLQHLSAGAGMLAAGSAVPASVIAAPSESFTFAHLTDSHITTERNAEKGMAQCFRKVNALTPDFVMTGGDQVMDTMNATYDDAKKLFQLWQNRQRDLDVPVHHVVGNHDIFGIHKNCPVSPTHPQYGREMFKDYMGQGATYQSFNYKGWHFILLDSVGTPPEKGYIGDVGEAQMDWLKADLEQTGKQTPIIVATHIPVITLRGQTNKSTWDANSHGVVIGNGNELRLLFEQYNVKMVLQGHVHIIEQMEYAGIQYISSGAVCGDWWRGWRYSFPEGFGVITCTGNTATWEYRDFGWEV